MSEPVLGGLDHRRAGAGIVAVDLRMVEHAEERQVLVRPVGEGEPVRFRGVAVALCGDERRMRRRHVVDDEVEQDAQPAGVGGLDQLDQVRLGPEARLDRVVVGGVVAVV